MLAQRTPPIPKATFTGQIKAVGKSEYVTVKLEFLTPDACQDFIRCNKNIILNSKMEKK